MFQSRSQKIGVSFVIHGMNSGMEKATLHHALSDDLRPVRQRRSMLRAPVAGACVTAFAICTGATAANAAVEEKCYNGDAEIAQLRTELGAEKMAPIYMGNQQNIGEDGQIFYSNANGSRGYVVAFNSPLKIQPNADGTLPASRGIKNGVGYDFISAPTKACVGITMANIKVFPTSGPGSDRIPQAALTGIDPAISRAALARDTFGSAAVNDESLPKRYAAGWRVAIVADTLVPEKGGERYGQRLIFGYRPNDVPMRQGTLRFVDGDGIARTMATTSATRSTELASALYRGARAAADPRPE